VTLDGTRASGCAGIDWKGVLDLDLANRGSVIDKVCGEDSATHEDRIFAVGIEYLQMLERRRAKGREAVQDRWESLYPLRYEDLHGQAAE